jgi:hypothetical protein
MESGELAHLPDTDWFTFGMLAARLLVNLEHVRVDSPRDLHPEVMREIADPAKGLASSEVDLLFRLIATNPQARLRHFEEIVREIEEVERQLLGLTDRRTPRLVLVVDPKSEPLVDACRGAGMIVDPEDEFATFNPLNAHHTATLTSFVRNSLREAVVHPAEDPEQAILAGEMGPLRLARWKDESGRLSWDMAFCVGPSAVSTGEGGPRPTPLPSGSISVRTVSNAHRDSTIRTSASSWQPYMPKPQGATARSVNQNRIIEFLRASNQVELVIRDAEVFPYRILSRSSDPLFDRIVIAPEPDEGERPA